MMTKESIDNFFKSISQEELDQKWSKYDHHSPENSGLTTINELLNSWEVNSLSHKKIFDLEIPPQQIIKVNIEKSESFFGLFYYISFLQNTKLWKKLVLNLVAIKYLTSNSI